MDIFCSTPPDHAAVGSEERKTAIADISNAVLEALAEQSNDAATRAALSEQKVLDLEEKLKEQKEVRTSRSNLHF